MSRKPNDQMRTGFSQYQGLAVHIACRCWEAWRERFKGYLDLSDYIQMAYLALWKKLGDVDFSRSSKEIVGLLCMSIYGEIYNEVVIKSTGEKRSGNTSVLTTAAERYIKEKF